jgi:DNA repair protein RadC
MRYETIFVKDIEEQVSISSTMEVYKFITNKFIIKIPQVIVLTLDDSFHIIGAYTTQLGKLKEPKIDEHEIFYKAILDKSTRIIVCYTHHQNAIEPSPLLEKVASSLFKSAEVLGITIINQYIISENGYSEIKEDD